MRFGILEARAERPEQLTFDRFGRTNSTVVRIDDLDHLFGGPAGKWVTMSKNSGTYGGKASVWLHTDRKQPATKIQVTQLVEIIPGEPVEYTKDKSKLKRFLDTVRVRYLLENQGTGDAKVGLRILLDTLIGENDGVPFTVPGRSGLVDKMAEFATTKQVPDFVQVLENADLQNPGIVGFMNFQVGW